jgi:hypothetical protein
VDTGHWTYFQDFDPEQWFGFVYRIVDLDSGQHYIGKKTFWSTRRKVIKARKNRKRVTSESKWREYTGSSTHLNTAISTKGKDRFLFIIESLHKSRGSLFYEEVRKQVMEDVLRKTLPDGITPKYYNRQIGGVRFIPPKQDAEEATHQLLVEGEWWGTKKSVVDRSWHGIYVRDLDNIQGSNIPLN